jgi:hypothetical protein
MSWVFLENKDETNDNSRADGLPITDIFMM